MALDGAAPGYDNWLWRGQPHESRDVDCRLCRDLEGTRPPTEISGHGEDLWSLDSDHFGRNPRQGDRVGGPIRDGEKRGFQYHERRLFPLEIPLAAHRRNVRHDTGRPHS